MMTLPTDAVPDCPNLTDDLRLVSRHFMGDELWLDGVDDSLMNRDGRAWSRLQAAKPTIAKLWAFNAKRKQGRPNRTHHTLAEFQRRVANGEVETEIGRQSQVLAEWYAEKFPFDKPLEAKSIAKAIKDRFYEAQTGCAKL